ncbi:hypothetical protein HanRHA438_Chr06g0254981 [Helianthus annuus]|nr:hypothetical protein HanRHA438_Chr06g0254981 [Helianthus annuus]
MKVKKLHPRRIRDLNTIQNAYFLLDVSDRVYRVKSDRWFGSVGCFSFSVFVRHGCRKTEKKTRVAGG